MIKNYKKKIMKKLLITLCLFVAFADNAHAQTKESITWLQEKLQKYIYYEQYGRKGEDIVFKISEC